MDDIDNLLVVVRAAISDARLQRGIEQYLAIQRCMRATKDLSQSDEFKRQFRHFYRMRRGNEDAKIFFDFMQQRRASPPSFEEALDEMRRTNRCEASFASKMVATFNPDRPVLDENVLGVMRDKLYSRSPIVGWKLLRTGSLDQRIERAKSVYSDLQRVFSLMKTSTEFPPFIKSFDAQHSVRAYELTATKKLDLTLWRYGAN